MSMAALHLPRRTRADGSGNLFFITVAAAFKKRKFKISLIYTKFSF
jgi:hypothetical protein